MLWGGDDVFGLYELCKCAVLYGYGVWSMEYHSTLLVRLCCLGVGFFLALGGWGAWIGWMDGDGDGDGNRDGDGVMW